MKNLYHEAERLADIFRNYANGDDFQLPSEDVVVLLDSLAIGYVESNETCSSCRFASVFDINEIQAGEIDSPGYNCKRMPPMVPYFDDGDIRYYSPLVRGSDWCGEFVAASK